MKKKNKDKKKRKRNLLINHMSLWKLKDGNKNKI